jgi:endonuclease/exonuclease/phosphatase (EEP) superfamily protein YafD
MKTYQKIIFYSVLAIGTLLILITLLSLIYDIKYWYIKALDFPRVQVLIGLLICLIVFAIVNNKWARSAVLFTAGLGIAIILQAAYIIPYTPLAGKAVKDADPATITDQNSFSLLIANVWMKNDKVEPLLDIIADRSPDIVLVMETNQWWLDQLSPLKDTYPHTVLHPLDNTYGMGIYSKLPLENTEIKFLSKDKVPSIHTDIQLRSGDNFTLHAVHPVPPKPSKHPDNQGEKEVALIKVGKTVAQSNKATIVAGDFNDVAWSETSRLFGTSSRLRDVRVGRWFYHSFDATSLFLRWPLDHVYVSKEFRLIDLKKLPKYGSDHFPILVKLTLQD